MTEYIITDEQIKEAVSFTPQYKTLSYAAKYKVSGAVELQGVAVHGLPEIVRCRDCERFYTNTAGLDCLKLDPEGFCAWASRKEVAR